MMGITGVNDLKMFYNPIPNQDIGICLGVFEGNNLLVGEEPGLFQKLMPYTLVATKNTLLFRYNTQYALKGWPVPIQRKLKLSTLQKHSWIYERLNRIKQQLLTPL